MAGLASPPTLCFLFFFSFFDAGAALPFLLCASEAAGVATPLGVWTAEGAVLEKDVSIFAGPAGAAVCDASAACSCALFRASTAPRVFS